jgi:hypothetical protein
MKETLLKLTEKVEFKSSWGSICSPVERDGFYVLPLGWEEELDNRNISYEVVEFDGVQEDFGDFGDIIEEDITGIE